MINILNILLPVILVSAIGFLLKRTAFLKQEVFTGMVRFTFFVAMPALLIYKIAHADFSGGEALKGAIILAGGMIGSIIIAMGAARLFKLPDSSKGAFIQGSFRGNLAFIGLPVVFYTLEAMPGINLEENKALAVLIIAPTIPAYNVLAVIFLSLYNKSGKVKVSAATMIAKVFSNPLLISCILGGILCALKIPIPVGVDRTLKVLSSAALPLALITIGASLEFSRIKGKIGRALSASAIKLAAGPLLAIPLAFLLKPNPVTLKLCLIFLTCPAAVSSYIMASQMKSDSELAGSVVVLSTLLSIISLSIAIAI